MFDSVYFVKSTPFRAFTGSYQHFEDMLRYIEDVHEEVWSRKNIFWQTYRVFNLAIYRQLHLVNNGW